MNPIEEIKNRLSIVEIVSEYVTLQPAGRNFKGLCPFHKDTNPSLIVSEEKQFAWCFACNNGGDIFGFVQKIENISFAESLKILAQKADVSLKENSLPKKEENNTLLEILQSATEKFVENFWQNKQVQEIVLQRKLSINTLKKFKVGFALKEEKALEKFLLNKNFSHQEILKAGLLVPCKNNLHQFRDKFINRIIFPFFNSTSSVIGFSGRILEEGKPKFLNSPETTLFKKSQVLYGFSLAKEAIKKEDACLITEGQFDVLSCFEHGHENTVAVSGTAFSKDHAKQIMRFTKNIIFAFDADSAGIAAVKRSAEIALKAGANVFAIILPSGHDPDSILRQDPTALKKLLKEKKLIIEFLFENVFVNKDLQDLQSRKEIFQELFPIILFFPKKFEQDIWLVSLAEKLDIDKEAVREDFKKFYRLNKISKTNIKENILEKEKISSLQFLLGTLLSFPDFLPLVEKNLLLDIFPLNEEKIIYQKIKKFFSTQSIESISQLKKDLFKNEEEKKKWEIITLFSEERNERMSENLRLIEFKKLIKQINKNNFQKTQKELLTKMQKTEDQQEKEELFLKLNKIATLAKNFS